MTEIVEKHHNHIKEIATLAYYKASSRGFEPGNELIDWIAAEQELESVIANIRIDDNVLSVNNSGYNFSLIKEIVVQEIIVKPIVVKEIVVQKIDIDAFVAMQLDQLGYLR